MRSRNTQHSAHIFTLHGWRISSSIYRIHRRIWFSLRQCHLAEPCDGYRHRIKFKALVEALEPLQT